MTHCFRERRLTAGGCWCLLTAGLVLPHRLRPRQRRTEDLLFLLLLLFLGSDGLGALGCDPDGTKVSRVLWSWRLEQLGGWGPPYRPLWGPACRSRGREKEKKRKVLKKSQNPSKGTIIQMFSILCLSCSFCFQFS